MFRDLPMKLAATIGSAAPRARDANSDIIYESSETLAREVNGCWSKEPPRGWCLGLR